MQEVGHHSARSHQAGTQAARQDCYSQYVYLPKVFGGLDVPSAEDEAHIARAAQAFKFLEDMRYPVVRSDALDQLKEMIIRRARRLDPTKLEDWQNSSHREGRAGDLHSLWFQSEPAWQSQVLQWR